MKKLVYLFLIAATLFACNQNEKSSNTDQSNNTPATTSPVPAASAEQYPAMPLDTLRMLYDRTDYIDFVFYCNIKLVVKFQFINLVILSQLSTSEINATWPPDNW